MTHGTVKTSLLALCAGAAFLAPYTMTGSAHAQAYRSVSGWSVKQAPFSDMGGEQSCTAMTRFDNGYTMQMTGTASGVKNLSIDVRQPAFQSGGILDVNLEVPGITAQQVQGQAYGNSLVVINMEEQKNLLAAMRSRDTLKVNMAGQDMTFALNGLADAAVHFEQCVGGANVFGNAPVITEAMQAVPAPVVEKAAMSDAPVRRSPPPVPAPADIMSAAGTPPAGSNLIARKAPPVTAPNEQFSAQDMERLEKRQNTGENFDPEAEFKAVPITQIAPPPPAMDIQTLETSESSGGNIPAVPAAAPVPLNPNRLSANNEKAEPVPVPQTQTKAVPVPAMVSASAPSSPPPELSSDIGFAEPLANPPRSGRYKRITEQLAAESGTPIAKSRSSRGAPRDSEPAIAVVTSATQTSAQLPAVQKPDKQDTRTPAQKAADEAAWDAIPGADTAQAPSRPVKETPDMITSSSSETTRPPQKIEADIIDNADGSKKIRTPDTRMTRHVEKVEMDMTKVGLPPEENSHAPAPSAKAVALEAEIAKLRAHNELLDEDLKAALAESKHEEVSVSSENWNLEKAAMRYNEAEKEIQRLGEQLRKERAQSAEEKKQLESMLFDPAVTDQKQIAKLAEMEEQLRAAQADLANQRRTYEERLRAVQEQKGK